MTLCLDSNRAYSMSPRDCAGLAIGLPTALSCPLLLFCKPCLPACDSLDFQGLLSGPVPCAPLFCPQCQGTGPVLRKHLIESVNPTLMCIVQGKVVHDSGPIILWVKFGLQLSYLKNGFFWILLLVLPLLAFSLDLIISHYRGRSF